MLCRPFCWIAASAALLLSQSFLSAETIHISTAHGNGADASVLAGTSGVTKNHGGNPSIRVSQGSSLGSSTFKAYLRFDLNDIRQELLAEASLMLQSHSGVGGTYPLKLFALKDGQDNWIEGTGLENASTTSGITWNTAPAIRNDQTTFNPLLSVFLGNFTAQMGNLEVGTNATTMVTQGMLVGGASTLLDIVRDAATGGDGMLTLMLSSDLPNQTLSFRMPSSESKTAGEIPPTLVVATATPEPSAFAMAVPIVLLAAWQLLRRFRSRLA